MNYWFYNTDLKALGGVSAADRLFNRGYAVTGGPRKFGELLAQLEPGDTLLMYENLVGVLGVGTVLKCWDGIAYTNTWYYRDNEPQEYRVRVDWYFDFTANPIHYKELRNTIGYVPRGALKRDLHKNDAIEELIARRVGQSQRPPKRNSKPKREQCTILRIVRDTGVSRTVKQLHKYRCQICGDRIQLPNGRLYAEAHHIRPLGTPHDGEDVLENVLCVCPNHHVELDYYVRSLDKSTLRRLEGHAIDEDAIAYHNKCVRTAKTQLQQ